MQHTPLYIGETEVERVKTFTFLGTHISEDFTWSHNSFQITEKARQRPYLLRRQRKFGMQAEILSNSYRGTVESVLTTSITMLYGHCPGQEGTPVCNKNSIVHLRSSLPLTTRTFTPPGREPTT